MFAFVLVTGQAGEKAPGGSLPPPGPGLSLGTSCLLSSCRGKRGKCAVTVSVLECWDLLLVVK